MKNWGPLLTALLVLGLLSGCQRSADQLERAISDNPAVRKVTITDNGGEDDLPFAQLPWVIDIRMDGTATEAQVLDVVQEFEPDAADEEVESISVYVGDRGYLSYGSGSPKGSRWVPLLMEGLSDPVVSWIFVDPQPWGLSLEVTLRGVDFATANEYFQGYRRSLDPIDLYLESGRFSFGFSGSHSEEYESLTHARLRAAAAVDRKYGLVGAKAWGYSPLELVVHPGTDLDEVRRFARQHVDRRDVRKIVVTAPTS